MITAKYAILARPPKGSPLNVLLLILFIAQKTYPRDTQSSPYRSGVLKERKLNAHKITLNFTTVALMQRKNNSTDGLLLPGNLAEASATPRRSSMNSLFSNVGSPDRSQELGRRNAKTDMAAIPAPCEAFRAFYVVEPFVAIKWTNAMISKTSVHESGVVFL
ncbi:hypothetical protein B0H10DRAFT_1943033 [Mycena sp. CBHHK59/15]|nr:hypothetical protein B0H10DRAFT_1943033 [Mycena sp. CBHHK59/15]